ncbi:hypothetical protein EJ08DRAFT_652742 [Tothia fuscella]|uniref:Uncharacterized protein n=1 Tax=Tothia fuscella TaxID=1048955 RepID=A0A9P4NIR3_9PEZI|nr:hypothetical protein EJ08DRAFT_652742 [Tothia fuscella]
MTRNNGFTTTTTSHTPRKRSRSDEKESQPEDPSMHKSKKLRTNHDLHAMASSFFARMDDLKVNYEEWKDLKEQNEYELAYNSLADRQKLLDELAMNGPHLDAVEKAIEHAITQEKHVEMELAGTVELSKRVMKVMQFQQQIEKDLDTAAHDGGQYLE